MSTTNTSNRKNTNPWFFALLLTIAGSGRQRVRYRDVTDRARRVLRGRGYADTERGLSEAVRRHLDAMAATDIPFIVIEGRDVDERTNESRRRPALLRGRQKGHIVLNMGLARKEMRLRVRLQWARSSAPKEIAEAWTVIEWIRALGASGFDHDEIANVLHILLGYKRTDANTLVWMFYERKLDQLSANDAGAMLRNIALSRMTGLLEETK